MLPQESGGFYSLLISLEITTLPPASFRGASAKTNFLLVGTSRHLASTDPSAMISWQMLPRCFREQRFKSYVGSPGASARASASIMLPQNLPHASARTARSTFRKPSREIPGVITVFKYRYTSAKKPWLRCRCHCHRFHFDWRHLSL